MGSGDLNCAGVASTLLSSEPLPQPVLDFSNSTEIVYRLLVIVYSTIYANLA